MGLKLAANTCFQTVLENFIFMAEHMIFLVEEVFKLAKYKAYTIIV